jgi:hypothetical protein
MLDHDEQRILLGNSISIYEEDLDDKPTSVESERDALYGYWEAKLLNAIGRNNFKYEYEAVIRHIIFNVSLEDQIGLCLAILERIDEVYDFVFPQTPVIKTKEDTYRVYFFLEFLEYNNFEFLISIWKYIKIDLSTKRLSSTCLENPENIVPIIDEQVEIKQFPEFISEFLRTYNKDKLINWFCLMSKKYETEITVRLMEETKDGKEG